MHNCGDAEISQKCEIKDMLRKYAEILEMQSGKHISTKRRSAELQACRNPELQKRRTAKAFDSHRHGRLAAVDLAFARGARGAAAFGVPLCSLVVTA